MLGKRLINSNSAAAGGSCTTDTLQILGDTSCVAYYKMSDATDESGNYNGTPTSVNFNVAGKFGNAGSFNGLQTSSASYLDISSSTTSTVCTISFWFNTTNKDSNSGTLIDGGGGSSANTGFAIYVAATTGYLAIGFTSGTVGQGQNITATTDVADGNWHNIVLSLASDNTYSLYLDGNSTPELTGTRTKFTVGQSQNLSINRFGTNPASIGASAYDGSIDEIRIFNKALTSSEVTTLYNEVYCVPTIVPADNFSIVLYRGTGSSQSTNSLNSQSGTINFAPNLVWIKERDGTDAHFLQDSLRGSTRTLYSNSADADFDETQGVTSFNSNGFTLGTYQGMNNLNNNFVAWNWYAPTAESNTSGSVNSTIKKNLDAGFSIATFTSDASTITVGHGLDSIPELIIVKATSFADSWFVNSIGLTNRTNRALRLNETSAEETNSGFWNNTPPTSTTFSLGSGVSVSTKSYVAYSFHSVDGYSKIGSYVGNNSTDGPNIVTGFRPAFVMFKATNASGGNTFWVILDNKRDGVNTKRLYANASFAEDTAEQVDFISNGFKIKTNNSDINGNFNYIFLAIAEEVFTPITRNATNPFGDASELALYKFEDNANDAEGNYNGTASNVTYVTGYIDKAAVFNGSSSIIRTNLNSGSNNLTYSAWINITAAPSQAYGNIVNGRKHFYTFLAIGQNKKVWLSNDQQVSGDTGDSGYATESTTVLSLGVWYHIVGTLSSTSGAKIYINGNLDNSSPNRTANAPAQTATSCIGSWEGSAPFNGKIDQLRIFNRVLDSGEVTALYNE